MYLASLRGQTAKKSTKNSVYLLLVRLWRFKKLCEAKCKVFGFAARPNSEKKVQRIAIFIYFRKIFACGASRSSARLNAMYLASLRDQTTKKLQNIAIFFLKNFACGASKKLYEAKSSVFIFAARPKAAKKCNCSDVYSIFVRPRRFKKALRG